MISSKRQKKKTPVAKINLKLKLGNKQLNKMMPLKMSLKVKRNKPAKGTIKKVGNIVSISSI